MIHIVTGKINSGKSTKMLALYQQHKAGDGFLSVKRMHYQKVHGYDIMKLSTMETKPIVIHEDYIRKEVDIICQIGPYLFLKDSVDFVTNSIQKMINDHVSPIFLDEIGKLELDNQCFHSIFLQMVEENVDCYISVKEDLVEQVIQKYQLQDYEIIRK